MLSTPSTEQCLQEKAPVWVGVTAALSVLHGLFFFYGSLILYLVCCFEGRDRCILIRCVDQWYGPLQTQTTHASWCGKHSCSRLNKSSYNLFVGLYFCVQRLSSPWKTLLGSQWSSILDTCPAQCSRPTLYSCKDFHVELVTVWYTKTLVFPI